MEMENYDLKISHRVGNKMQHVDALGSSEENVAIC